MCSLSLCGTFCSLTSIFGVLFLAMLGYLIDTDYKHVGEWYEPTNLTIPTKEQKDNASSALYATAAVYFFCFLLSAGCICVGGRKKREYA
ncbi:unnamed protein product [Ostreobium quekettii]|uniref:Uncharacterized protein n=1 Tax=Ostreobium quekettii TaxID=121088 RepID=A0A8S1IWF9_9CHLO|nr:unnamed protein product [Ostreobium quekettii]